MVLVFFIYSLYFIVGPILGNDEMITKAIVDRLFHFSYLFNITGPSYRLKDKLKINETGEN